MVTETELLFIVIVVLLSWLLHLIFSIGGHKQNGGVHGH